MSNNKVSRIWWDHFLYLEELLLSSERHVAFIENNFETTSVIFMHIILAACADIECILKEVLKLDSGGVKEIGDEIKKDHNDFLKIKIPILPLNCEKEPWLALEKNTPPLWWVSYNDIKHNKNTSPYRGACLIHAIEALAGLFSVNLVYYTEMLGKSFSKEIKLPKLFEYEGLGAENLITDNSYNIKVPGFL